MVNAEELGISSQNIDEALKSKKPDVMRFVGTDGAYGEELGLTKDWAARIIRRVGNYGEVYERNVGRRLRARHTTRTESIMEYRRHSICPADPLVSVTQTNKSPTRTARAVAIRAASSLLAIAGAPRSEGAAYAGVASIPAARRYAGLRASRAARATHAIAHLFDGRAVGGIERLERFVTRDPARLLAISPMPSNIFLHHVLDAWYETEVRPRMAEEGRPTLPDGGNHVSVGAIESPPSGDAALLCSAHSHGDPGISTAILLEDGYRADASAVASIGTIARSHTPASGSGRRRPRGFFF